MGSEEKKTSSNEVTIRCTSAFDCGGRGPLRVHVEDGVITRIEGDDFKDEDGQLRACWRGRAYRHWIYHPDRLKYPMKKENGAWKIPPVPNSEGCAAVDRLGG